MRVWSINIVISRLIILAAELVDVMSINAELDFSNPRFSLRIYLDSSVILPILSYVIAVYVEKNWYPGGHLYTYSTR